MNGKRRLLPPRVDRIEGHTFFPSLLPRGGVVVDLGANYGRFSKAISERYGVSCFAVEASPSVWKMIEPSDRVRKFNYAITGCDGPVQFYISSNCEASSIDAMVAGSSVRPVTVEGLTYGSFVRREDVPRPDLLKVDIEGAELALLESLSDEVLKEIPQITVEFHESMGCMSEAEVKKAIERLRRLGFEGLKMSYTTYADMLFVNRGLVKMSGLQVLWFKVVTRNLIFARRLVGRIRNSVREKW